MVKRFIKSVYFFWFSLLNSFFSKKNRLQNVLRLIYKLNLTYEPKL